MRAGLRGSDDYLNEWRKSPPEDCDTDMAEAVARIADNLEQKFNQQVLRAMIDNFGFTPNDAQ